MVCKFLKCCYYEIRIFWNFLENKPGGILNCHKMIQFILNSCLGVFLFAPTISAQTLQSLPLGAREISLVANKSQIPEIKTQTTARGSIIWDLEVFDDRIFIGMGDYDANTGPIDIVNYNTLTGQFETPYANAPTEATEAIRNLDGHLYVLMTDPQGYEGPAFVHSYQGSYNIAATIRSSAHYFDLTKQGNRLYLATGEWYTGGQRGTDPAITVPNDQDARIYSSANNGASWDLEFASHQGRFYRLGANSTTVFANGNGVSAVKENGAWRLLDNGEDARAFSLNDNLRIIKSAASTNVWKISGNTLVTAETKPFATQNSIDISAPNSIINQQVLWAIATTANAPSEIWATTDYVNWVKILGADQLGGFTEDFKNIYKIAYHNNNLYLGSTVGSLYVVKNVFDVRAGISGAFRIKNRWTSQYIVDGGDRVKLTTNASDPQTIWQITKTTGNNFTLTSFATKDLIHIQNMTGYSQCTAVSSTLTSAQWFANPTDGFYRIGNVFAPNGFLSVENKLGYVEAGPISLVAWSAQWSLEPAQLPPNQPPVANAGADRTIPLDSIPFTLSGKGSTDPDGDSLQYRWTEVSKKGALIDDSGLVTTKVTCPAGGVYLFELRVSDGKLSAKDTVRITVDFPTGIKNALKGSPFVSVIPVVGKRKFQIFTNRNCRVAIYGISGNEISSFNISESAQSIPFNLRDGGEYIVKVVDSDTRSILLTKVLIIQ